MIRITFEANRSVKDIQKQFEKHLSKQEILKSTAGALNYAVKLSRGFMERQVKRTYTIDQKYVDRSFNIQYASHKKLYSAISISRKTLPLIAFPFAGKISPGRRRMSINVTIQKGKTINLKHAFIANFKSGHIGIYSSGSYVHGKFAKNGRTASGKQRITELYTASPFGMAINDKTRAKIKEYASKRLHNRLRYLLQRKLDKMRNI